MQNVHRHGFNLKDKAMNKEYTGNKCNNGPFKAKAAGRTVSCRIMHPCREKHPRLLLCFFLLLVGPSIKCFSRYGDGTVACVLTVSFMHNTFLIKCKGGGTHTAQERTSGPVTPVQKRKHLI